MVEAGDSGGIAAALVEARREGRLMPRIDDSWLPDIEAARAIQGRAATLWGGRRVGWKIGATAAETQVRLGIQAPFAGPLFEADSHESGAALKRPPGLRAVEIEVAFRLGGDLEMREEPWTLEEVRAAVASMHPAIEVVATRQELAALDGLRAIADFGVNAAFVHGPAIEGWEALDLPAVSATCLIDGEVRASGPASVVMGSPLEALRWLANEGVGLASGDWVTTGTLTGMQPVGPKARVLGDFGALGRVSCSFES
jgi:2-keto-4-pentenoate hydratase